MASGEKASANSRVTSDALLAVDGRSAEPVASLLLLRPRQRTSRLPESSVLSRARQLLPQLRRSEETLRQQVAARGADSVSIETEPDPHRPHIEMSLSLCELDSDSESDSDSAAEVTAENLRLPGETGRRRGAVQEVKSPCSDQP